METRVVYVFNENTKEFITKLNLSDVNYKLHDGMWKSIPNSTEIAPPEEQDGYIRVFSDGKWGYEKEVYPS